jgi:chaperonin cofactor prefoldin
MNHPKKMRFMGIVDRVPMNIVGYMMTMPIDKLEKAVAELEKLEDEARTERIMKKIFGNNLLKKERNKRYREKKKDAKNGR